jgi:hypothetical protein
MLSYLFRALLTVILITAPTAAHAAACDRLCLNRMLESYFAALVTHDASRLPLSADVRFTENGAVGKIGEGLWQRAGAPTYRLDAVDPVLETAASNSVVTDNGRPVILFVRLKVVDELIIEIETIVVRPREGQYSTPEALTDPAPYNAAVPASLQASREEMSLVVGSYLDALATAGTNAFTPARIAFDARRVENGVPPPVLPDDAPRVTLNDVLARGFGNDKLRVSDQRFPVFDDVRGIAVMIAVMNLDTPARPPLTPGGPPTGPGGHAVQHIGMWKQIIVEVFKISDGMIQEIQATIYDLDDPAIQSSGWPVPSAPRP